MINNTLGKVYSKLPRVRLDNEYTFALSQKQRFSVALQILREYVYAETNEKLQL